MCKLVKSLYDLKQAPKQWHQKFNKVIAHFELLSMSMTSAPIQKKLDNDYIIFCLYVNDFLIFDTSLDAIQRVKDYLF